MPPVDPLPLSLSIRAVDVHGHYGAYSARGVAALAQFDECPIFNECKSATAAEVAARARKAGIEWTVVSPLSGLLPRGRGDPVAGNEEAFRTVPATPGLRQWVIVDPLRPETFAQARAMLEAPWCVGIKIHPEEHVYPIREHGARLLEFAASRKAVVLAHTGGPNSLPEDFVPFMNALPELRLILAHLGNMDTGDLTHQVRAVHEGQHRNMFVDTSSARSITPRLIEWGVREIGADRLLFGTDTPLYHAGMMRARIDFADISEEERRRILSDNARSLLSLES